MSPILSQPFFQVALPISASSFGGSITSSAAGPGPSSTDDNTGATVVGPTSASPYLSVALRGGRVVKIPRADNITVSRLEYEHHPSSAGAYEYTYTLDSRQVWLFRLGQNEDTAQQTTQEQPKNWDPLGLGWVSNKDSVTATDSKFVIRSTWRPGLMPMYLAGAAMQNPMPPSGISEDNARMANAANIFVNSLRKFVIGPAIKPAITQAELQDLIGRWVNDYGF
jgi:hypothetical protein